MTELFLRVITAGVTVGALAGALLLAVPALGRRYPARWRSRVWLVLSAALLLAVLPLNALMQPRVTLTVPPAATQTLLFEEEPPAAEVDPGEAVLKDATRMEATEYGPAITVPGVVGNLKDAPVEVAPVRAQSRVSLLQIAAVLWLVGAVCSGLWQCAAWWSWKRRFWRWLTPADAEVQELVRRAAEEHGLTAPRTLVGARVSSPMLVGALRPVLLLPGQLPPQNQLLMVLRHEMTHLRRGDLWAKLLLLAARTVHWYQPLVWAMVRRAHKDIELACDEQVTGGKPSAWRSQYCQALLGAVRAAGAAAPPLSTQFAIGKEELMNRFAHVMKGWPARRGLPVLIALVLTALLCCCGVGLSAGSESSPEPTPPQSVSGEPDPALPDRDYGPYPIANWDKRLTVVRTYNGEQADPMFPYEPSRICVVNDSEVVWEGTGKDHVVVLRNWQDNSPDLFYVVTPVMYKKYSANTVFRLYDADGTLLMELQGAAPSWVSGRELLLLRFEGVDESVTGDCLLNLDTGAVSRTGVKTWMEIAGARYLVYSDHTEQVDEALNTVTRYEGMGYMQTDQLYQLESYVDQLEEQGWNDAYSVRMVNADRIEDGVLLCDAAGEPVCELPLMRILNDGYAIFHEDMEQSRFRLMNVYTGEVVETDSTRRYEYYSETVKLYQDDALVWGEWYLDCPTGVYGGARTGRVGESFWYQEWPAEHDGEPTVLDYSGRLHILNAQGEEVFCGENAELFAPAFGDEKLPEYILYRRIFEDETHQDQLVDERGAALGFGGTIRSCNALEQQGLFIAENAEGRWMLCSVEGDVLLEADDLIYDESSGALLCLDGDRLGLLGLNGVWLWQAAREDALSLNP